MSVTGTVINRNKKKATTLIGDPGADRRGERQIKRAKSVRNRPFYQPLAPSIFPWVSKDDPGYARLSFAKVNVLKLCTRNRKNLSFLITEAKYRGLLMQR